MPIPPLAPAALVVLLALVSWTPFSGDPMPGQEEVVEELPLNRLKRIRREQQQAELNGAWHLNSFLVDGTPVPPDEIDGNAVFCDGFMSLTIHAVGYDEDTDEEAAMAQSGIYRFSIDDHSALQTLTVIGHSTPQGNIRYEPVGGLREYKIRVDGHRVDLRHHSGRELSFVRMEPSVLSGTEIARLGRALAPKPESVATVVTPSVAEEELSGDTAEPQEGALNPLYQHQVAQQATLKEQMVGPWYLAGYMVEGVLLSDDEIRGAAIICDGYMSLVIHALEYADEIGEEIQFAQAGIYRYRLSGTSMLQTSTVIGHANPIDGVDYEVAGGLRQYEASIVEDALILRSAEGTALRFVRMSPRAFTDYETALFNRYGQGTDFVEDE